LAETLDSPQPLTKPHPPIMIGGVGEKRTLPLVAKYADACNLYAFEGADVLRSKLAVLRRHCDAIGRPFDEIERTAIASIDLRTGGTALRAAIEFCRSVSDAGIEHLVVSTPGDYEIAPIELIGKEIIPRLADLSGS
jgi:alkanesulfonate monooxygenase SsuD/methylene tetrahydromethanopterin reductase-like flavin-dependent oxidoreductase (luciferase family)